MYYPCSLPASSIGSPTWMVRQQPWSPFIYGQCGRWVARTGHHRSPNTHLWHHRHLYPHGKYWRITLQGFLRYGRAVPTEAEDSHRVLLAGPCCSMNRECTAHRTYTIHRGSRHFILRVSDATQHQTCGHEGKLPPSCVPCPYPATEPDLSGNAPVLYL